MKVYTTLFQTDDDQRHVVEVEPYYCSKKGLFCLLDPSGDFIRIPFEVIGLHRRGFRKDGRAKLPERKLYGYFKKYFPPPPSELKKTVEVPTPDDMNRAIEKMKKARLKHPNDR